MIFKARGRGYSAPTPAKPHLDSPGHFVSRSLHIAETRCLRLLTKTALTAQRNSFLYVTLPSDGPRAPPKAPWTSVFRRWVLVFGIRRVILANDLMGLPPIARGPSTDWKKDDRI